MGLVLPPAGQPAAAAAVAVANAEGAIIVVVSMSCGDAAPCTTSGVASAALSLLPSLLLPPPALTPLLLPLLLGLC